jgi:hypothetical protein
VLVELAQLLAREKEALVLLDREAIEGHAARKLELDAALQAAALAQPLSGAEKELLAEVRAAALANQLLLAHARSCVQGVLSLVAPGNMPAYAAPGQSPQSNPLPPPIALNLRR